MPIFVLGDFPIILSIAPPSDDFCWMPFGVQKIDGVLSPAISWKIEDMQPKVKVAYYVDQVSGNDANPGSFDKPLRSISVAVAKANADMVYIRPGTYKRTYGLAGTSITRSMSLKKWPGETDDLIITCAQDGLVWVLDDTFTYSTSRSGVTNVIDISVIDGNGNYETLVEQTSIADVKANPGSWYLDGANDLWVQTSDSRVIDTDIWPMVSNNGYSFGNVTIYCEDIKFFGGQQGGFRARDSAAGQEPRFYAKNCEFAYATANGFTALGCAMAILQDCHSYANLADGFNYHSENGIIPKSIEINCIGRDNGLVDGIGNDNGSSTHDGGSIVRLGCEYENNVGPNVNDIDASHSWNVEVFSHDSNSDLAGNVINFATSGFMWLDTCVSSGSTFDLSAGVASIMRYRNLTSGGPVTAGAGTFEAY